MATWMRHFVGAERDHSTDPYTDYTLTETAPNSLRRWYRVTYDHDSGKWYATLSRAATIESGFDHSVDLPEKMQDVLVAYVRMTLWV